MPQNRFVPQSQGLAPVSEILDKTLQYQFHVFREIGASLNLKGEVYRLTKCHNDVTDEKMKHTTEISTPGQSLLEF